MGKVSVVIPSRRDNVLTLASVDKISDYVADMHIVKRGSVGEAMNRGAAKARAKVILFLDDDVEFTREFFLECLNDLETTPNSLVGLRTSDGMSCMFTMIRKQDLKRIGGIRLPNYYLDTELLFRAESKGLQVFLKPPSSVQHLIPTPSGFWGRRQRLLWFHSAYVRIQYPHRYTENSGQWQSVHLRHFILRRRSNLLKNLYMNLVLAAGVLYYRYMRRALDSLTYVWGRVAHNCGPTLRLLLYICLRLSARLFLGKQRRDAFLKLHPSIEDMRDPGSEAVFWYAVRWARHEPEVTKLVRKMRGTLFVDVGADKGYYSLFLQRNFERIIAFEPGDTYSLLLKHIAEAHASNILPVKKAVSNFEGQATMLTAKYWGADKNGLCAGIHVVSDPSNITFPGYIVSKCRVECCSLASALKDEPVVDLIKMDVEGGEWNVLKGAEPITERIQCWIIELHDLSRKADLEAWFRLHGYRYKWLRIGDTTAHVYGWRASHV